MIHILYFEAKNEAIHEKNFDAKYAKKMSELPRMGQFWPTIFWPTIFGLQTGRGGGVSSGVISSHHGVYQIVAVWFPLMYFKGEVHVKYK